MYINTLCLLIWFRVWETILKLRDWTLFSLNPFPFLFPSSTSIFNGHKLFSIALLMVVSWNDFLKMVLMITSISCWIQTKWKKYYNFMHTKHIKLYSCHNESSGIIWIALNVIKTSRHTTYTCIRITNITQCETEFFLRIST